MLKDALDRGHACRRVVGALWSLEEFQEPEEAPPRGAVWAASQLERETEEEHVEVGRVS